MPSFPTPGLRSAAIAAVAVASVGVSAIPAAGIQPTQPAHATHSTPILSGTSHAPDSASWARVFGRFTMESLLDESFAWDSCSSITYRVNLNGAGKKELARIRTAFDRVEEETALSFRYQGKASSLPYRSTVSAADYAQRDPNVDVTIAFAKPGDGPRESPLLAENPALSGMGGPVREDADGSPVSVPVGEYVAGAVLFNRENLFGPKQRLNLYMHEFGHVVGLDHTTQRGEVMMSGRRTQTSWGEEDRAGLRAVGYTRHSC